MSEKPLVSFCIGAYNQKNFIREAVESAFNQDYENLEIIISDDCSSDETFEIAKAMAADYKGPHKIILNRNERNLGIREHCNRLLYELSHGEYIIMAAGDDVSTPDRTRKYAEVFEKFPQVVSISCKSLEVDINMQPLENLNGGGWSGNYTLMSIYDYVLRKDFCIYSGDSRGLRRSVIDAFPPLKYPGAEDIYLFVRGFYVGLICYIEEPLVKRRHHTFNASSKKMNKESFKRHRRQLEEDLKYAHKHDYLSPFTYKLMKFKMRDLHHIFKQNFTEQYFSLSFAWDRAKMTLVRKIKTFKKVFF